ncbi:helix-turn-helix domain-containing protein [Bacillus cereus group sp. MYBK5-1]|uniref:Putative MerR-family transcriptional regulator n=2 Tax=Betatectivirus TaxID=2169670 RepID=A0A8E8PBF9_9VIRU|nr:MULTISPECIES: helix-turn-helix domain-containing protein [Bacillus cereus group]YP_010771340.1 putative MerR-family transcriptional regulator [Bacillus phage Sato]YP_010771371.1 putative MerR-family transcriptional regulator [Bacillus phage Sole]MCQ6337855.1 helix-turn-helix domain-containing protein [Bacillus cereus]EJR71075.1 excisionase family DNA binding domain-containing protein [Bacillus cereus VD166]MDA1653031.1 helix-turn-helix domain-containing protein [Bacillus cereus group sp. TH
MSEQYYTIKEVATQLKVSERTVHNWIKKEQLASYKVGRLTRISEEQLKAYLEKEKQ